MSKKKLYSAATVLIVIFVSLFNKFNSKTDIKTVDTDSNKNTAYVHHVVDGDTLVVILNNKKERLRLIGIDTPESVHPKKEKNSLEGKIASNFTKSILEHKNITLEFDVSKRDKYGRLLAYVFFDNKLFNKTLIEKGYARVYTFPPNVKYKDTFVTAQKIVRLNKVGFWKNFYK